METIKRLTRISNVMRITLMLIIITVCIGCSKDDNGSDSPIQIGKISFTTEGVNDCNSGQGTRFRINIPYTSSSGSPISKVTVKSLDSKGGKEAEASIHFTNNNDIVLVSVCLGFNDTSWSEDTFRLTAADGNKSNSATLRINRPAGAN